MRILITIFVHREVAPIERNQNIGIRTRHNGRSCIRPPVASGEPAMTYWFVGRGNARL